jgi:hypothetical protein
MRGTGDDDVLDEDWFKYRMVRSHRLVSLLVLVIEYDNVWLPPVL